MITEDPQLEMRLRHYGSVVQDAARVNPELHGRIIARVDHRAPARPHRFVAQLAVVVAMILVAVGGVALMLRVRANELAKAEPRITSVSPADGATGVPLDGEFRVLFASRTTAMPVVSHEPADGTQATGQWLGTTLVVKYSGLRSHTRYGVVVSGDYTSSLGGKGHFEKRWSFTTEFGPPPAGVPLIWYSTSPPYGPTPPAGSLVAIDWNGDVVGMLHAAGGVNQSPDGSRLDVAGRGYVDQAGHPISAVQLDKGGPGWSDDSRHVCVMRSASGGIPQGNAEPAWLFAGPIEGPLHRVAQAGSVGGQSGPRIVACSYQNDRAVVVEDVIMWTSEVWVYRLSTGALLYHHQYTSGAVASSVMASRDGRYLAEQTTSTDAQGHQIYADTFIRRTPDGAVVARLSGQTVNAFSWDGSRVITTPALGSADSHEVRLVDWQRGQTLWRLAEPPGIAPGFAYVFSLARPGGTDLIVGVAGNSTGQSPVDQLWLVHADGAATSVAKGPIFPSFQEGF